MTGDTPGGHRTLSGGMDMSEPGLCPHISIPVSLCPHTCVRMSPCSYVTTSLHPHIPIPMSPRFAAGDSSVSPGLGGDTPCPGSACRDTRLGGVRHPQTPFGRGHTSPLVPNHDKDTSLTTRSLKKKTKRGSPPLPTFITTKCYKLGGGEPCDSPPAILKEKP